MKINQSITIALLSLSLIGCAGGGIRIVKQEAGIADLGNRMQVTLDTAWNHISYPSIDLPGVRTWTMHGLALDTLTLYSGIKHEQNIQAEVVSDDKKPSFRFRSEMQPDQVVALFEGALGRDGSVFRLKKLEPTQFAGGKGFRFEYSLTRKSDNVELSGVASARIERGELYALVYQAPKLGFFSPQQARIAQIMASASIGGAVVAK